MLLQPLSHGGRPICRTDKQRYASILGLAGVAPWWIGEQYWLSVDRFNPRIGLRHLAVFGFEMANATDSHVLRVAKCHE
jgi:hypothetical protein